MPGETLGVCPVLRFGDWIDYEASQGRFANRPYISLGTDLGCEIATGAPSH